jgi:hypothetical protein
VVAESLLSDAGQDIQEQAGSFSAILSSWKILFFMLNSEMK